MLNPRVKAARVALYTVVLASLCTTGFMLPFAKALSQEQSQPEDEFQKGSKFIFIVHEIQPGTFSAFSHLRFALARFASAVGGAEQRPARFLPFHGSGAEHCRHYRDTFVARAACCIQLRVPARIRSCQSSPSVSILRAWSRNT